MQKTTVLVVDPDDEDRDETATAIRDGPVDVAIRTADSLEQATERLDNAAIDLVVTRHDLGDGTGLDLAASVRETTPDAGVLLYAEETEMATESYEEAVVNFVPRDTPGAEATLLSLVEQYGPQQRQASYPVPENEPQRRAAIDQYLDETDDIAQSLDRITTLAAQHLDVGVASINVVDQHTQWFLSTTGPQWPPGDRDDSICTHTLVHDEPTMMVEDVGADPRFHGNETLLENEIVAYLGAKIEMPDGHVIGTLCAYDDEPRTFSPEERSYLETLAALTADIIVLGADGGERE